MRVRVRVYSLRVLIGSYITKSPIDFLIESSRQETLRISEILDIHSLTYYGQGKLRLIPILKQHTGEIRV